MKKSNFLRCMAQILILLIILWITQTSPAATQAITPQATTPLTNKELVRNGTFDQDKTAWGIVGSSSGVSNVGQDGGPAMSLEAIMETETYIYQELHLPTQTSAATFSFDFRMLPSGYASGSAQFYARVITPTGTITTVLATNIINYDTGWQSIEVSLTTADVAQIQALHEAGQRVYIIFNMVQSTANSMKTYLDNVSFKVSGSMNYPDLTGSIAYIGLDDSGYAKTVKRIDPDGSNQQTVWTYPDPLAPHIYDVAWKPDATELAFSSDHEFLYSAFHADVYGIQPDGSGLRRITNPPSKARLDAGGYLTGTVTGRIYNNYGTVSPFYVYIEGATEVVAVDIAGQGSEVNFRVESVADLGPGTSQYIVFDWSDMSHDCANGKEYAAIPVSDVIAGQDVDVGTLTFNGNCYDYNTQSIAWRRDGSQVGFFVESLPKVVPASGATLGDDLFNIGTVFAEDLAWSPAQTNENEILYRRSTFDTNSGFYLTTVGGGIGTLKASDRRTFGTAIYATQTWLPGGSGFVYTLDNYLYEYTLSSSQVITLATFYNEYVDNPSVSPDGNYVVFERISTKVPIQYDLWILNRSNPVEMWPLTNDGKSSNPDWSKSAPSACTPLTALAIQGPTTATSGTAVTLNAIYTPTNATSVTLQWDNGATTSSTSYTWPAGEHTAVLTATATCGTTFTATHTVQVTSDCTPLESISIDGPHTALSGTAVILNAIHTPTNATNVALQWDNGMTTTSTSYIWSAGEHTAMLTATAACGATFIATHTVQVTSDCLPLNALDIQGPTTATSGTAVTLNAVYTPTDATGVTLQWDNDATTTSASYTWAAGEHTAVLTATAACGEPIRTTHAVHVTPPDFYLYLPLVLRDFN